MSLKKNSKKHGGDGYGFNVNQAIGGLPARYRFSNNYAPVFCGDLLQNGGDCGCKSNSTENINFLENIKKTGGGGRCGCNSKTSEYDPSIFELIELKGGKKIKNEKISQFYAIQKISNTLTPLSTKSLLKLNLELFLKSMSHNKNKLKKIKQFGGYVSQLENILAPLGKNNLLVLASLLILHYFAVEKVYSKNKVIVLHGGEQDLISSVFMNEGLSTVYDDIFNAFYGKKKQTGGSNPFKDLIAPLGTNAFIATGLLIILEKLFSNKIKEIKNQDEVKQVLIGGKLNKSYEKLFNILAPITFNTFAKKSFLEKMVNDKV